VDQRIPVILDVDTGIDDAFALLLAATHPRLNLLGVTCVDGNAPLADVVRNTIRVLDAAQRHDVPVVAGAHQPLVAPPHYAFDVHGHDGFGGIEWPEPSRAASGSDAVSWLRDTILACESPVTLITLAPLTTVAQLLQRHPDVAANLKRIVVMGGSAGPGNVTALAEFNVHHDPHAAAIVFACDVPITMYGLDVFNDVVIDQADVKRLAESSSQRAQLASRLATFFADVLGYPLCIGDAGAVCAVIDPEALSTTPLVTTVVTDEGPAYGMTAVDRRPVVYDGALPLAGRVVDVALDINASRYSELWLNSLMS
jgi:pyrimidine-specific ribonucleoside hydrolase